MRGIEWLQRIEHFDDADLVRIHLDSSMTANGHQPHVAVSTSIIRHIKIAPALKAALAEQRETSSNTRITLPVAFGGRAAL